MARGEVEATLPPVGVLTEAEQSTFIKKYPTFAPLFACPPPPTQPRDNLSSQESDSSLDTESTLSDGDPGVELTPGGGVSDAKRMRSDERP